MSRFQVMTLLWPQYNDLLLSPRCCEILLMSKCTIYQSFRTCYMSFCCLVFYGYDEVDTKWILLNTPGDEHISHDHLFRNITSLSQHPFLSWQEVVAFVTDKHQILLQTNIPSLWRVLKFLSVLCTADRRFLLLRNCFMFPFKATK